MRDQYKVRHHEKRKQGLEYRCDVVVALRLEAWGLGNKVTQAEFEERGHGKDSVCGSFAVVG